MPLVEGNKFPRAANIKEAVQSGSSLPASPPIGRWTNRGVYLYSLLFCILAVYYVLLDAGYIYDLTMDYVSTCFSYIDFSLQICEI